MWKTVGKSVIGTAHESTGAQCQDFCSSYRVEGGVERLLLAISDGAGFAIHAAEAARLSVEKALALMAEFSGKLSEISEASITEWLGEVKKHLEAAAADKGVAATEFSCTLLGAIIEGESAHFWQVGDGAWIVQTKKGVEVATWPYSGDFINQTVFATSPTAFEHWTHAAIQGVSGIFGFTDGLEHLALDYPNKKAHEPLALKLFNALSANPSEDEVGVSIEGFLGSALVSDRTDDDKTMLLAWRESPALHVDG
jgi:hypothetical protein